MGVSVKPGWSSSLADGADAAVHHVAGRDDVGAGFGVAGGGAGEEFERGVVQDADAAFVALDDAAMAVRHVFAQADVGDDQQFRQFLFEQAHGLLDDAVGGISAGGLGVLGIRDAEQQNGGHAEFMGAGGVADQFIGRKLENAGHGLDGTAEFAASADEEWQDQLRGAQIGFRSPGGAGRATGAGGGGGRREIVRRNARSWRQFKFKAESSKRKVVHSSFAKAAKPLHCRA